jgi:hypothetical protein
MICGSAYQIYDECESRTAGVDLELTDLQLAFLLSEENVAFTFLFFPLIVIFKDFQEIDRLMRRRQLFFGEERASFKYERNLPAPSIFYVISSIFYVISSQSEAKG